MTDDAELRARIEAQVAARRAGSTSAKNGRTPASDEPAGGDEQAPNATHGPRALTPARPWSAKAAPSRGPESADEAPDAPEVPKTGGRSRWRGIGPARPWANGGEPASPATPAPPAVQPPEHVAPAGRLQPARPWARRPDDEPAEVTGPPAPAVYAPDDEAVNAFAEAAAPMLDLPEDETSEPVGRGRRRRRGRETPALWPRHAALSPSTDEVPAPQDEAGAAYTSHDGEGDYPWLRKQDVDLDLHGAPTWDPGVYPGEPDASEQPRTRRALRWLLARAPEPEPADSVTDEAAEPEADAEADTEADTEAAAPKRRRLFSRRHAEREEDDYVPLELPEPDAAFERPWLQTAPAQLRPTRDWARPSAPAPVELPEAAPAPAPELAPEPVAETIETVEEPIAEAAPEPEPVKRRPSPGASADGEVQRRRPSPGPAAADASAADEGAASPFELASSAPAPTALSGGRAAPDLVQLLKTIETADAAKEAGEKAAEEPRGRFHNRGTRLLVHFGVWVAIAVLAAVLLRLFVVQPYYIPSASMEPTLHGCSGCNDDHVLVDKISYHIHGPKRGDIVVFDRPKNVSSAEIPDKVLIKRVIATGGQQISIKQGKVYVDNGIVAEGYLNKDHSCYPNLSYAPHTVPRGYVFVMGDNRCDSVDSRVFGPIPDSSIVGRAFMKIWPLGRLGFLH